MKTHSVLLHAQEIMKESEYHPFLQKRALGTDYQGLPVHQLSIIAVNLSAEEIGSGKASSAAMLRRYARRAITTEGLLALGQSSSQEETLLIWRTIIALFETRTIIPFNLQRILVMQKGMACQMYLQRAQEYLDKMQVTTLTDS